MAVAVICEFNPFHNGHKYLLSEAKRITEEPIIAIMSGSFTQRGEVAITDKLNRCETALKNGVDLVLELPTVYAVSSANRFAYGGVQIAKSFDCVNYLAFGCENSDISLLQTAADAIEDECVKEAISKKMKEGEYFPRALEASVRSVFGKDTADILASPNNILAVEYIRSLRGSGITPLPIMRIGTSHDSTSAYGIFASASHIRDMLRNDEDASSYSPELPTEITHLKNLERVLLYKLRTMCADDFMALPDVNEGLENRIVQAVKDYNSIEEILSSVKTKRYTHARLRRILTCALLGITEELQNKPIEYVRVLGFTKSGSELLKSCKLETVTSPAKALRLGGNIEKLLRCDIAATDISALAYSNVRNCGTDYTAKLIKL